MASTSSPKNSARTGCGADGENTSRMPPRSANCPTPSTSVVREYPAAVSRASKSSISNTAPGRSVMDAENSVARGIVRRESASNDATTTFACPVASAYNSRRRLCSHSRETPAAS